MPPECFHLRRDQYGSLPRADGPAPFRFPVWTPFSILAIARAGPRPLGRKFWVVLE